MKGARFQIVEKNECEIKINWFQTYHTLRNKLATLHHGRHQSQVMGDEHGVFVSAQEVLFAEGVEGDHLGRGPAPSQDDAAADIRLTRGGYVVGGGGTGA